MTCNNFNLANCRSFATRLSAIRGRRHLWRRHCNQNGWSWATNSQNAWNFIRWNDRPYGDHFGAVNIFKIQNVNDSLAKFAVPAKIEWKNQCTNSMKFCVEWTLSATMRRSMDAQLRENCQLQRNSNSVWFFSTPDAMQMRSCRKHRNIV